jgi:phosphonate transport system substrate-binding protein
MENEKKPDFLQDQENKEGGIQKSEVPNVENESDLNGMSNLKKGWLLLGVVALIVIFLGFIIARSDFFGTKSIVDGGDVMPAVEVSTESDPKKERVRVLGVLPLHNPTVMLDRFGALENYLNENTDLNIKMKFYPTEGELGGFSAVVKDVAEGVVDFAFLASVTTVQANANGPVIPIACAQRDGSPTYQGDLVVKIDSPYQTTFDLKGKKVAGTSVSSTSGNLMPLKGLAKLGIDPNTYFDGGIQYLGSHDKALEAVSRDLVDAAYVNEHTFFKFVREGSQLRSIWRHPPVPEFPFVVNTDNVSQEEIDIFVKALLLAHESDPKIVTRIDDDYEKFVEIAWEDYIPTKEAVDEAYGEIFYDLNSWGKK